MIVPISVQYSNEKQPHVRLAIVPRFSEHPSDIARLKAALLDVMKTCFLNEENKDCTSEVSLFYVTSLIEALECDNAQDFGEENDAIVSEIQKLYNDTFDKKLPPCTRLTKYRSESVKECVSRFGRQSVNKVFEQVLETSSRVDLNKLYFTVDFDWIFQPRNYKFQLELYNTRTEQAKQKGGNNG